MAKKTKRISGGAKGSSADSSVDEMRADVTWRHVGLLSAFAILLVVSIFTVMIPELTDDGAAEEADAAGTVTVETAAPASDTSPAATAPSASAHTP